MPFGQYGRHFDDYMIIVGFLLVCYIHIGFSAQIHYALMPYFDAYHLSNII